MEKGESSSASLRLVISARQDPSSYYGLMVAPLTKSINEGGVSAASGHRLNFRLLRALPLFPSVFPIPPVTTCFLFVPICFLFLSFSSLLVSRSSSTDIIQFLVTHVAALTTKENPSARS